MRDIKKIIKETVNPPKSPDELRFMQQHKGKLDDKTPQDEDSYAKGIKKAKRPADNEGDATYDKAYAAESTDLEEKAESKAQAISARIALAAKRGKLPKSKLQGASKEMMKMSEKDLEDYTKAKKGAPYKVEEQSLSEDPFEEIPMMQRQLDFISYAAEEISEYLEMTGDPEEWFQNKLAHIHGQMQNLHAYMEGEMRSYGRGMYEENELTESVKAGSLKLDDGTKVNVSKEDAETVNSAMGEMSPANRKKMMGIMMKNKDGFNQILDFVKAAV